METQRLTMAIYGLEPDGGGADQVRRTLSSLPGVTMAYVNPATEMAYVEYEPELQGPDGLLAAVQASGYKAGELFIRSAVGGHRSQSPDEPRETPAGEAVELHSCCEPGVPAHPAGDSSDRQVNGKTSGVAFKYRLAGFGLLSALVLGIALWLVISSGHSAGDAEYTVDLSMAGFNPSTLVVPAGQPITIKLTNVDSPFHGITNGALHQFAIDELGLNVKIDARQSTVITLPPMSPGSYHFYCDVCCGGKANPSMQGTLIIHDTGAMSQ